MSVSNTAKCLLTRTNGFLRTSRRDLRCFHASPPVQFPRRRPRYQSISAADLKLMEDLVSHRVDPKTVNPKTLQRLKSYAGSTFEDMPEQDLSELNEYAKENSLKYKEEDQDLLSKKYHPSQLAAIRAAEQAIDDRDIITQGRERTDPMRIRYTDDDFLEHDYVYDKPKRAPTGWLLGRGQDVTMKNDEEIYAKLAQFIVSNGKKYTDNGMFNPDEENEEMMNQLEVDWLKFAHDPRTLLNAPNEETYKLLDDPSNDIQAADLPQLKDPIALASRIFDDGKVENASLTRLSLEMGWEMRKIKSIQTKTLVTRRVVNQTRMGKVASMYYLVVAGNGDGLVGIGEGKSTEALDARQQATMRAIRNMRPIERYERRTIYGEIKTKVGGTEVTLTAKHPGFGNRAMHLIFEITRAAGIQDLHARVPRARNKMNVCKATIEALHSQRLPEEIARGRGRKLVDVRKVYYGIATA